MNRNPRIAPSDIVVCTLLGVVTSVFAVTPAPRSAVILHGSILLLFGCATLAAVRFPDRRWTPWLRSTATVIALLTLYLTIWEPAFEAFGGRDALLSSTDVAIFGGVDPVRWVADRTTPRTTEIFSFIYGWFIPYIYLSILLGCYGRPEHERRSFLLGLSITYAISYMGYLFVPAHGPILHTHFDSDLHGGFFHNLVLDSVKAAGGPHGAFPSIHVGATSYLMMFDLRWNRLRGMTYVPIAMLIGIATIVLRYHYVVDVIAGLTIALVASGITRRVSLSNLDREATR